MSGLQSKYARDSHFDVTYYRDHGIHEVQNGNSTDYLASFPNWEELASNLKRDLPKEGRIITPEYITVPPDLKHVSEGADLIRERIQFARSLTKKTDAELILGSPTRAWLPSSPIEPPREVWHNSALTIRHGEVTHIDHKSYLLEPESEFGIVPTNTRDRIIKNGQAVLICAELYNYPDRADPLVKALATEIVAPMSWAVPSGRMDPLSKAAIERRGGEDSHYQKMLEQTIGHFTLRYLPGVNRVVTVDKGRPDLAPYNAIFTRTHTTDAEEKIAA